MKLLGRLLALCLTMLTAALLSSVYLLNSQHGLEWSYRIAATVLPGELTIDQVDGHLRGPFTLRGLHYRNGDLDLTLAQVHLQWRPGALVVGRLQVDGLSMTGLHILQPSTGGNTPSTLDLPEIRLPLAVHIDQALLHDLRIGESDQAFVLNEASLTNTGFDDGRLHLERLAVTAPAYRLELAGELTARQDYPLDLTLRWSANGGDYGMFRGQAQLHGDFRHLNVRHRLTAPARADLRGSLDDVLTRLRWQGELHFPETTLQTLRAQWPALALSGTLQGKGDLRQGRVQGGLHSRYQTLRADHHLALSFNHDTLILDRFETTLLNSDARLELHGTLSGLGGSPQYTVDGRWQDLDWPLQDQTALHSASGRFSVKGNSQGLTLTGLEAQWLRGAVTANGTLDLSPKLRWQAEIRGEDLDPAAQWPTWPGHLAFTARSSGTVADGVTQLQVILPRLQGELSSIPLDGEGAFSLRGDRLELSNLRLDAGGNRLTASGSVQEDWDLQWQIQPITIESSTAGGIGSLQGDGAVNGPLTAPSLSASLTARRLHIAHRHIDELTLSTTVDLQDRMPSTLALEAQNLSFEKLRLETLKLRGDGTTARHQARLAVTSAHSNLDLQLDGGYEHGQWTGKVAKLDIEVLHAGRWTLSAPASVTAGADAVYSDELCLQRGDARVCTKAQWDAIRAWQAQATARAVPLSVVQDWLPPGTTLAGQLDADAQAAADAAGLITARAETRFKAGVVSPVIAGKEESAPDIIYHQGQITISLDKQALSARLQADLAGGGLKGTLRVERQALPIPLGGGKIGMDNAVSGQLQGDTRDLSLLPTLLPGVEHTQGRLHSTLTLAGSWDKPQLMGELRLEDGSASVPALGISPEAIRLVAKGDEQGRLSLDARLRSKGGELHLKGGMHYEKGKALSIEAQLDGDKAEIVNTPEFHILASPDLRFGLKGRRIDLKGEIFIPEANLRPRDVSGAVSPSDDVVIVSGEGPPAPENRWQIYSELRVRLGDFVKFHGFGLNGLLGGDLTLSDAPQRPTVARGELSIKDGEYRAYGQKLSVERGRLLFFGGPVDNPGLDIRAARHIQEVTAGILVRGTLKTPQVQIFSEPAMAETDALSYLLTGRPINQASASEGQQLYGAALSLGLASSGLLASQIGQRFGIDEVLVESGGSFGSGALVIRHYLSPKLYISYGVGLVERFNAILIRYQISRRWALEAESGIQSGADLVYTLEK